MRLIQRAKAFVDAGRMAGVLRSLRRETSEQAKIAIRQRLADLLEQRRGALVKIGQLLAGTEEDPLAQCRSDLQPIAWEDIERLLMMLGAERFHLFASQ